MNKNIDNPNGKKRLDLVKLQKVVSRIDFWYTSWYNEEKIEGDLS